MSLLLALSFFTNAFVAITRLSPGTRVDGNWVDGSSTVFANTPVSIRPVSGKDMASIPEGQQVNDVRTIMCAFQLHNKDVIAWDSGEGNGVEDWEVFNVRPWAVQPMPDRYTRAMLQRVRIGM